MYVYIENSVSNHSSIQQKLYFPHRLFTYIEGFGHGIRFMLESVQARVVGQVRRENFVGLNVNVIL